MKKISDFSYNIYSQFGEDGIIEKIFSIIGTKSKICVEFGAWDGEYLSNTANLWKNHNWKAILVESDATRINQVKHSNVIAINATVGTKAHDSIDYILNQQNITEIDFMSIDIDGNDYHILDNLICQPHVICVEYNPTIPFWVDCYQEEEYHQFGASLKALNRVAAGKGYFLVSVTDTNLFFVKNEYKDLFKKFETDIPIIACYKHYISVITNYCGEYKIVGTPPYKMKTETLKNIIIKE